MRFSYYKTANRIVSCNAIIAFCERFWCNLVNTREGEGMRF